MIQFQGQGKGSCQAMLPSPPRLLRPQPQKGEKWSQTVKNHPHFVADRKLFTNFATNSGNYGRGHPDNILLKKRLLTLCSLATLKPRKFNDNSKGHCNSRRHKVCNAPAPCRKCAAWSLVTHISAWSLVACS